MAVHDYHEALPGYRSEQIWHDGCGECEYRGRADFADQLGWLDAKRFVRAWERAAAWQRPGGDFDRAGLADVEMGLLRGLWAVRCKLGMEPQLVEVARGPMVEVLSEYFSRTGAQS